MSNRSHLSLINSFLAYKGKHVSEQSYIPLNVFSHSADTTCMQRTRIRNLASRSLLLQSTTSEWRYDGFVCYIQAP